MPVQLDGLSTLRIVLGDFLPPCSSDQPEPLHFVMEGPTHKLGEGLEEYLPLMHLDHAFYPVPTSPMPAHGGSRIDRLYSLEMLVEWLQPLHLNNLT